MFDKNKFAQVLKNICETYSSQRDFSKKSEINRTYLSQYMNMKLDEPPKPSILQKLADSSNGVTTYKELMEICDYSEESIESIVYDIYIQLKKLIRQMYKENSEDLYEVESAIGYYQDYSSDLLQTIEKKDKTLIHLTDFFNKKFLLEDYNYVCTFLFLYDSFLKCLENSIF